MPTVVAVGARALLDAAETDAEFLGVRVGLFAELAAGRRVEVDPAAHEISGPRRGLGAVWVSYDESDPTLLPGFDPALAERDREEAVIQAIEASYRLQQKDIEDTVRLDLCEGGAPLHAESEMNDEEYRRDNERQRDLHWANLVSALEERGIQATPSSLRGMPFRMEFDAALLAELERESA